MFSASSGVTFVFCIFPSKYFSFFSSSLYFSFKNSALDFIILSLSEAGSFYCFVFHVQELVDHVVHSPSFVWLFKAMSLNHIFLQFKA